MRLCKNLLSSTNNLQLWHYFLKWFIERNKNFDWILVKNKICIINIRICIIQQWDTISLLAYWNVSDFEKNISSIFKKLVLLIKQLFLVCAICSMCILLWENFFSLLIFYFLIFMFYVFIFFSWRHFLYQSFPFPFRPYSISPDSKKKFSLTL